MDAEQTIADIEWLERIFSGSYPNLYRVGLPCVSLVMGPAVLDNSTRMTNALWRPILLCKYKTADRRSCNSLVGAGDYCPAHRKLMDDVDALDKDYSTQLKASSQWGDCSCRNSAEFMRLGLRSDTSLRVQSATRRKK